MIRSCWAVVFLSAAMMAQDSLIPKVRMIFPAHSEKVYVRYGLRQPGGSYSQHVAMFPAEVPSFEIPVPTGRMKALVWIPGCKLREFDVAIGRADIEMPFVCDPLKTVTLHGRVKHVNSIGPMTLSVDYSGMIACFWVVEDITRSYSGSCSGLDINGVATTDVAPDGYFEVELPDFSNDPIASGASHQLDFWLTGIKDVPPFLVPESTPRNTFKFAASYPDEVTFVPLDCQSVRDHPQ